MPGRRKTDAQRAKEGRGRGSGPNYTSWLHPREVPSQGLCTRTKGVCTGRRQCALSNLERRCQDIFGWLPETVDIRENYPLDLQRTQAIAADLGFRHPAHPTTKQVVTMTTDLVITLRQGLQEILIARAIKPVSELGKPRTLEKLEIERRYWGLEKIDWGIITEVDIPTVLAQNISRIKPYHDLARRLEQGAAERDAAKRVVAEQLQASARPLRDIAADCDRKLGLARGGSLAIAYHLIAIRAIAVDMDERIAPDTPLKFITGRAAPKQEK